MPEFRTIVGVSAALFVAYAVVLIGGLASPQVISVIDSVASAVVPATATVFAARAGARTTGRLRAAWTTLAAGLFSATFAEAFWGYHKLGGLQNQAPSIADVAYLLFPVAVVAAILVLSGPRSPQSQGRFVLDGIIMAASLLLVSWLTVIQPLYAKGSSTALGLVVDLAYPITNIIALTVATIVLARAVRVPLLYLAAGLAFLTVAEMAYAYVSAGGYVATHHLINVGWMAGMLLITMAAARAISDRFESTGRSNLPGWASVLLPYAPLMLVGIVLAADSPANVRSPMLLGVGAVLVVAVLAREVLSLAENRRLLAAESDRAMRDPLTGLANQSLFQDRLRHALQLRPRTGQVLAVLTLDLDDFKLVNDSMGHQAGDKLLIASAQRLVASVRLGDTVARLGGDEFAVLIEGNAEQWIPIAQRVAESFDHPFAIDRSEVSIRPSMGLAVADSDEPDLSAEDVMKRADIAMYTAKKDRGGGIFTFSAGMLENTSGEPLRSPRNTRLAGGGAGAVQLLGELRSAIKQFRLTLLYQPKFDAQTGAIVGLEALLRWPHPQLGLLGPEAFLPLVRRHGLMDVVTDLVINVALDDALVWHQAGVGSPVAVNLFPPVLGNLALPRTISKELRSRGLPASALTVEITEDLLLDDMESSKTVLNELRDLGIEIAIDDFGSGYSALSYLAQLPIDEVKLDRDFIAPILHDERAAIVIGAVVDLAHKLGLRTVAEGVEDEGVAVRVRELGCDVLQGFHFSRPLPANEVLQLLSGSTNP